MSAPPRKVIHLPKIRMLSRGGRQGAGIKITNVRSIKPPDPEMVKRQEEEKLRAQLQKEIVSRSRKCLNSSYPCGLPVVSGRQHCAEHLLQDRAAPYQQCAHAYSNGLRCPQPAPDHTEHALCFEHSRAALQARQRAAAPPPPVTTTEALLHRLSHYVRSERVRTGSCASSVSVVSEPDLDPPATHPIDPFKQIDSTSVNSAYSSSILECASASDSDGDSVTLGEAGDARGGAGCSDTEDAPCEDWPLWRAGVFTAEEAVSETKEVLKSLQSAYIRQMGRLKQLLQSARLQYLRTLKAEKEQYCSINAQARSAPASVRERRQLRHLRAYAAYHARLGAHALLARKQAQRRNAATSRSGSVGAARCAHGEGGYRCGAPALPAARHCAAHILHDSHQVLYVSCGERRGEVWCREPAPRLPPPPACRYHAAPPTYTTFTLKKDSSDSSSESGASSDESHTDTAELAEEGCSPRLHLP